MTDLVCDYSTATAVDPYYRNLAVRCDVKSARNTVRGSRPIPAGARVQAGYVHRPKGACVARYGSGGALVRLQHAESGEIGAVRLR